MQWRRTNSVQLQNYTVLPFKAIARIFNVNTDSKITSKVNFSYKATLTQTRSHLPVDITYQQVSQFVQQVAINYDPGDLVHFKY
jgi:hypothetical protein